MPQIPGHGKPDPVRIISLIVLVVLLAVFIPLCVYALRNPAADFSRFFLHYVILPYVAVCMFIQGLMNMRTENRYMAYFSFGCSALCLLTFVVERIAGR